MPALAPENRPGPARGLADVDVVASSARIAGGANAAIPERSAPARPAKRGRGSLLLALLHSDAHGLRHMRGHFQHCQSGHAAAATSSIRSFDESFHCGSRTQARPSFMRSMWRSMAVVVLYIRAGPPMGACAARHVHIRRRPSAGLPCRIPAPEPGICRGRAPLFAHPQAKPRIDHVESLRVNVLKQTQAQRDGRAGFTTGSITGHDGH
ncbi:hypothetical protein Mp_5g07530 [Marchantia polymorpha subsp. ruderalis]|uniref:Uncharacterized protein n=2 Tax=Marchantia polymorpha TaxID=3197 RepID=A0AAF6BFY2_MARPO|nr:hypothetical protein MARPO_0127s0031 [Marchantia polymorpha]BBN10916.1 hypothetical protein Mp_5g07530 [Marchantia polymorpha subsp. ruderalis]|eukprot:PTQ30248.1 hypothetical protein MARPO_0127s0031 [Marchantia polymorpha]